MKKNSFEQLDWRPPLWLFEFHEECSLSIFRLRPSTLWSSLPWSTFKTSPPTTTRSVWPLQCPVTAKQLISPQIQTLWYKFSSVHHSHSFIYLPHNAPSAYGPFMNPANRLLDRRASCYQKDQVTKWSVLLVLKFLLCSLWKLQSAETLLRQFRLTS